MHPKLKLFIGLSILFLSPPVFGIVNLEQAIIGPTEDGFHNRLDLLASGTSGNTENKRTKVDLLSLWKHEANTEFIQIQYSYGTSLGTVDTDNAFAHIRHRTEITPDWGVEAYAQISRDPFARLSERTLYGGGVRWVLFEENKKSAAYLGLGAFDEFETRTTLIGTTDQTKIEMWRANVYLVLKYNVNDYIRLLNNTYYQPAISNSENYRLYEQASMLIKMADNLDLKLALEYSYDAVPPQTVKPQDIFYSTGLSFSF